jgi:hypothetical protein
VLDINEKYIPFASSASKSERFIEAKSISSIITMRKK